LIRGCFEVERILIVLGHLHLVLVQLNKEIEILLQRWFSESLKLFHPLQEGIIRLVGIPEWRPVGEASSVHESDTTVIRKSLDGALDILTKSISTGIWDLRRRVNVDEYRDQAHIGNIGLHEFPWHDRILT
jgi:hypothetical protein